MNKIITVLAVGTAVLGLSACDTMVHTWDYPVQPRRAVIVQQPGVIVQQPRVVIQRAPQVYVEPATPSYRGSDMYVPDTGPAHHSQGSDMYVPDTGAAPYSGGSDMYVPNTGAAPYPGGSDMYVPSH